MFSFIKRPLYALSNRFRRDRLPAELMKEKWVANLSNPEKSCFDIKPEISCNAKLEKGSLLLGLKKENFIAWVETAKRVYVDQVIEARFRFGPQNGYSAAGIMFRVMENGTYYLALVSSKGFFRLDAINSKVPKTLIAWTEAFGAGGEGSAASGQISLGITAVGSRLFFAVNGKWVAETNDDSIPGGHLGFAAASYSAKSARSVRARSADARSADARPASAESESADDAKGARSTDARLFGSGKRGAANAADASGADAEDGAAVNGASANADTGAAHGASAENAGGLPAGADGHVCEARLEYLSVDSRPSAVEKEYRKWSDGAEISAESRLCLAETFVAQNRFDAAYDQVLKVWKQRESAARSVTATYIDMRTGKELLFAARIASRLGRHEAAEEHIKVCLSPETSSMADSADEIEALAEKAKILSAQNKFRELSAFLPAYIQKVEAEKCPSPPLHALHALLGQAWWNLKNHKAAAASWTAASDLNPGNPLYAEKAAAAHRVSKAEADAARAPKAPATAAPRVREAREETADVADGGVKKARAKKAPTTEGKTKKARGKKAPAAPRTREAREETADVADSGVKKARAKKAPTTEGKTKKAPAAPRAREVREETADVADGGVKKAPAAPRTREALGVEGGTKKATAEGKTKKVPTAPQEERSVGAKQAKARGKAATKVLEDTADVADGSVKKARGKKAPAAGGKTKKAPAVPQAEAKPAKARGKDRGKNTSGMCDRQDMI